MSAFLPLEGRKEDVSTMLNNKEVLVLYLRSIGHPLHMPEFFMLHLVIHQS